MGLMRTETENQKDISIQGDYLPLLRGFIVHSVCFCVSALFSLQTYFVLGHLASGPIPDSK